MNQRKLDFTKDFLKEIAKLPPKHFRQVVTKALALLNEPDPPDSKQLEG
jgi:mRNA-degrading endonuclease RelE of RelBE toxin-antitoxin system